MIRKALAAWVVLVLLWPSQPAHAEVEGTRKIAPAQRSATDAVWPGGRVVERWHRDNEMSLYLPLGRSRLELRYRGSIATGGPYEVMVILDDQHHSIELDNLIHAMQLGKPRVNLRKAPVWFMEGLSEKNTQALSWIAEQTQGRRLLVTTADRDRLLQTISRATELLAQKDACLDDSALALAAISKWLLCTSLAAGTAGASLGPCFIIGAGAHFLSYQAIQSCGGGTGHDLGTCDCTGPAPDCMCCPDLEEGDECTCYCPGEECCDWPDG